jgi:hypothetical protein
VDKAGKRFMNELRENRHGFGHKEYLLYFDGVIGAEALCTGQIAGRNAAAAKPWSAA